MKDESSNDRCAAAAAAAAFAPFSRVFKDIHDVMIGTTSLNEPDSKADRSSDSRLDDA
jgi:NaMN:DMB phosphoribosyltransferase